MIFGSKQWPCGNWLLGAQPGAARQRAVLQNWVLGYVASVNANVLTVSRDVASGWARTRCFLDRRLLRGASRSVNARAAGGLVSTRCAGKEHAVQ